MKPRAFCNEENPSWRILVRAGGASSYETHSALFTPMLLWRCRGDQLMQNIAKQCCKNLNTAVSWLVCRVFLSSLVFEVAQFTFWCSPAALARGGKRKRCFPPFVQTYCKHSPCVQRFWVSFGNKGLRKTLNLSFSLIHYIYAHWFYSCQERLLKSAITIVDYRHVTR